MAIGRFSSENILMSVAGHLALLAVLVTSFVLVVKRATLVAPDHIEIMEIDLAQVRVSGDESILYNVGEPTPAPEQKPAEPAPAAPVPEPVAEPEPIETPTVVGNDEDIEPTPEPAQDTTPAAPAVDTPAPQKRTVVRVNRESVSVDRTLTASVLDALRVAMTRCWVIDSNRDDIADIRAVAHLTMNRNGTVRNVWFESAARAETDAAFAYVLDTIRAAIQTCQPLSMLPPAEFATWEKIQLTFYPTQGKVM